jgi:hypothetical protein
MIPAEDLNRGANVSERSERSEILSSADMAAGMTSRARRPGEETPAG